MEKATVPAVARQAGYTQLVFNDDFDDLSTIDTEVTGAPGFNWYLDRPFGWPSMSKENVLLRDSVLTLNNHPSCANWGLASYSAKGDTGAAFRYGYFEARIRFDAKLGRKGEVSGFPAWWCFSKAHTTNRNDEHWAELDFFEGMLNTNGEYTGTYVATVHDWIREDGRPVNRQNTNNWIDKVVTDGWHDYGCLWKPGEIEWYLDGEIVTKVTYGADKHAAPLPGVKPFPGCYSFMDTEEMLLILGTCQEWPIEVDWVHVWQA